MTLYKQKYLLIILVLSFIVSCMTFNLRSYSQNYNFEDVEIRKANTQPPKESKPTNKQKLYKIPVNTSFY